MDTECDVALLAQPADAIKESAGSDELAPAVLHAQFLENDANALPQTNGTIIDEGIPYDPDDSVECISDSALNTTVDAQEEISPEADESEVDLSASAAGVGGTLESNSQASIQYQLPAESFARNNDKLEVEMEIQEETIVEDSEAEVEGNVVVETGGSHGLKVDPTTFPPSEWGVELQEAASDRCTSDLLTQLQGDHTEFSDALNAQVVEVSDNNNFENAAEVLNKKELLDILEGNEPETESAMENVKVENKYDVIEETIEVPFHLLNDPEVNKLVAIQQLSSLPRMRRVPRSPRSPSTPAAPSQHMKRRAGRPRNTRASTSQVDSGTSASLEPPSLPPEETVGESAERQSNKPKDLIKVLVEDWDDDELIAEEVVVEQSCVLADNINMDEVPSELVPIDSTETELETTATSTPPQRRMSRVIKKKVIFDPDNPDTFTSKKSPSIAKMKSPPTDSDCKEHPAPKKVKAEVSPQRAKEKSPSARKSTTQWKKPPPKNNKQHKRLSEVDKLLMDEGAVNMMYQLNASGEAEPAKGKKNIRSKAAFIKKINQSTPESNEIKFRERRKEPSKVEEGVGAGRREGRSRTSGSNSAASPAACDYETHSADDSIIIRRHSSSSYSSSCLSPRRLSDLDVSGASPPSAPHPPTLLGDGDKFNDVFMSDAADTKKTNVLDKNDCLSLKEKLNSKLSRVLKFKRKRDVKTDRADSKPKNEKKKFKVNKKNRENKNDISPNFKKLSVRLEERVAEINILHFKQQEAAHSNVYDIETLKELKSALEYIDGRREVSVTLLVSESGNLCGGLDLHTVLQQPPDNKLKAATDVANAVRSLFVCMERHSKFVCAGVEGACVGVGVALLALCDVVVASDRATFRLLAEDGTIVPGTAVLNSYRKSLCRSLITEMLVLGRQLSATEALSRGLVSRTLWPDRFSAELRAMVRDIAAQSLPTLQLKKQLLGLRNHVEPKSTFLSCLDAERDLLTAYWSSVEGPATMNVVD